MANLPFSDNWLRHKNIFLSHIYFIVLMLSVSCQRIAGTMTKTIIASVVLGLLMSTTSTSAHYQRPPELYKIVKGEVTAYTVSKDETDDTPSITASGETARIGGIACPKSLEFGTKVEIAGKVYRCNDRMNARYKGHNYDILVSSKQEAIAFGRKFINVKIYE